MHLTENQIQAYVDQNLLSAEKEFVEIHLKDCSLCQEQVQVVSDRTGRVNSHLAVLSPQSQLNEAALPVEAALQRLQIKINQKESQSMFNKLFSPRLRPVWSIAVIVLVLVVAFSFPQVRAMANSFLGLFRVQQVAVVPVDTDALSTNVNYVGESMFDALFETASEETLGQSLPDATVDEASSAAGIPVRVPSIENLDDVHISVEQGIRITFKVDQPLIQAIFDETQLGINIPEELDGATVMGEIPPAVFMSFDCELPEEFLESSTGESVEDIRQRVVQQTCKDLIQVASPSVEAPSGLDISAIGQGFLQLMGMSADDAQNFSQTVDWATTLVIPVPETSNYENVSVDGVEGVLLREVNYEGGHYILIWVKDDIVYALSGKGNSQEALELAGSLK